MDTPTLLTCEVQRQADTAVVTARGELDFTSENVLQASVEQALTPAPTCVVLDFALLSFCDSTGLSALIRLRDRVQRAGSRLVIHRPSRQAARLFTVTGLDGVLDIQPADEALGQRTT